MSCPNRRSCGRRTNASDDEILLARRKLCFKMAELMEPEGEYDIDKAAKTLESILPLSIAEAEAEMQEFSKKIVHPQGPTTLAKFKEAMGGKTMIEAMAQATALRTTLAEREKFKAYVHQRLDEAGVPIEVAESEHTKAGCRIGGRLDWLFEQLKRAEGERFDLHVALSAMTDCCSDGSNWRSILAVIEAKLAAVQRENERLREAVEILRLRYAELYRYCVDQLKYLEDSEKIGSALDVKATFSRQIQNDLAALLSPPNPQGEEVRDG